ncbi:MAG TPA: hypothetical protein VFB81_19815, partial [Myxococcales bacterium]|nr:hypothetical protein [Myxococcales bacterium]
RRIPPDLGRFEFASEIHFSDLRVDGFLCHPVWGAHAEQVEASVDRVVARMPPASRPSWTHAQRLAERIGLMAPELKVLVSSFWLALDAASIRAHRGPGVFYFTLRDHQVTALPAAERVFSRRMERLCEVLLGGRYSPARTATLQVVASTARPSHRLAHVGVDVGDGGGGRPPRLKTYFFGTLSDHLALCRDLRAGAGMKAFLQELSTLERWFGDERLTLVLDLEAERMVRVDLELYFDLDRPRENRALREALFGLPMLRRALPEARLDSVRKLFARGKQARRMEGYVTAYQYASHLKVSRLEGQPPQWKLYLCYGAIA